MRWQQTRPLLPAASFRQDLINRVPRDQPGKYSDPYPVSQSAANFNLTAHGTENSA
jgi:hypothetical protein